MHRLEVKQQKLVNVLGRNSVKRFRALFIGEDERFGGTYYIPELGEIVCGERRGEYLDEIEVELEYIGRHLYVKNYIFPLGEEVEEPTCLEFA